MFLCACVYELCECVSFLVPSCVRYLKEYENRRGERLGLVLQLVASATAEFLRYGCLRENLF